MYLKKISKDPKLYNGDCGVLCIFTRTCCSVKVIYITFRKQMEDSVVVVVSCGTYTVCVWALCVLCSVYCCSLCHYVCCTVLCRVSNTASGPQCLCCCGKCFLLSPLLLCLTRFSVSLFSPFMSLYLLIPSPLSSSFTPAWIHFFIFLCPSLSCLG